MALRDELALYTKKLWWLLKTSQGQAVQFVKNASEESGISFFHLSDSGAPAAQFRFTRGVSVSPVFAADNHELTQLHAFVNASDSRQSVGQALQTETNLQMFNLQSLLPAKSTSVSEDYSIQLSTLLKGGAVIHAAELVYEL